MKHVSDKKSAVEALKKSPSWYFCPKIRVWRTGAGFTELGLEYISAECVGEDLVEITYYCEGNRLDDGSCPVKRTVSIEQFMAEI